jgi:rare lipoprotein A
MNTQKKYWNIILWAAIATLTACGGNQVLQPDKKVEEKKQEEKSTESKPATEPATKEKEAASKGGYYLDDGPGDDASIDIDSIPNAQPKPEELSTRANRPYIALEQQYTPMIAYAPYKEQGKASWYGKRYHGKRTSTGEVYDMYGMTAAHTILPIPSYAKVTNLANGRSVIVRINDRGPFKNGRLIDLSYAAAYKLRIVDQGSATVEVEAIDSSFEALQKNAAVTDPDKINKEFEPKEPRVPATKIASTSNETKHNATSKTKLGKKSQGAEYFVQVGAFKSEENSVALVKKIETLQRPEYVEVSKAYNGGLHRVKVGPYTSKNEAEAAAKQMSKQFGVSAIVQN